MFVQLANQLIHNYIIIITSIFIPALLWLSTLIYLPLLIIQNVLTKFKLLSKIEDKLNQFLRALISPVARDLSNYNFSLTNAVDPYFMLPYKDSFTFPEQLPQNLHFLALCSKLGYEDEIFIRELIEKKWNAPKNELKYETNVSNSKRADKSDIYEGRIASILLHPLYLLSWVPVLGGPITRLIKYYTLPAIISDSTVHFISTNSTVIVLFNATPPSNPLTFSDMLFSQFVPVNMADQYVYVNEGYLATLGLHQDGRHDTSFYDDIRHTLLDLLSATDKDGNEKKFVFTGHGIGGGLAHLFATKYLSNNNSNNFKGLYTYGQPHVGNSAFVAILDEYLKKNLIHRVVNNSDIISTTPLHNHRARDFNSYDLIGPNGKLKTAYTPPNGKFLIDIIMNGLIQTLSPPLALFLKIRSDILYLPLRRTLVRLASLFVPFGPNFVDHMPAEYEFYLRTQDRVFGVTSDNFKNIANIANKFSELRNDGKQDGKGSGGGLDQQKINDEVKKLNETKSKLDTIDQNELVAKAKTGDILLISTAADDELKYISKSKYNLVGLVYKVAGDDSLTADESLHVYFDNTSLNQSLYGLLLDPTIELVWQQDQSNITNGQQVDIDKNLSEPKAKRILTNDKVFAAYTGGFTPNEKLSFGEYFVIQKLLSNVGNSKEDPNLKYFKAPADFNTNTGKLVRKPTILTLSLKQNGDLAVESSSNGKTQTKPVNDGARYLSAMTLDSIKNEKAYLVSFGKDTATVNQVENGYIKTPEKGGLIGDWTHLVPVDLKGLHVFAYNSNSGEGKLVKFPDKDGVKVELGKDWTGLSSFTVQNDTYLLAYNKTDGNVVLYKVNSDFSYQPTQPTPWTKNGTHTIVFKMEQKNYLLTYKEGKGTLALGEITDEGVNSSKITKLYYDVNWTNFELFYNDGHPYLLSYKKSDGTFQVHRIKHSGKDLFTLKSKTFATSLRNVLGFAQYQK